MNDPPAPTTNNPTKASHRRGTAAAAADPSIPAKQSPPSASLEQQLAIVRDRNGWLEQQLEMVREELRVEKLAKRGDAATTRLILAILAGLLGWAPPLVLELYTVWTLWGFCCRRLKSKDGSSTNYKCTKGWKTSVYIFGSLLDCTDAILDLYISVTAINSCTDNSDQYSRKWALVLFCATIAARIVGGVFGAFYESIEESDREASYFLVEVTIFFIEDFAAFAYFQMLINGRGQVTRLDTVNVILSFMCAIVFVISTVFKNKNITKRLPRCASLALLIFYGFTTVCAGWGIRVLTNELRSSDNFGDRKPEDDFVVEVYDEGDHVFWDFLFSFFYPFFLALQLFVLYGWFRKVAWKKGQPRGDPIPESAEFSV